MEYDNGGVEDFGLPCPPWEDYAAAFDDHSIINLHPDTFFDGLDKDDHDHDHDVGTIEVICSKEIKVQSIIKHGRGKELKTAIRVLKPTADQLAATYRLHDKKKNKDNTKTGNILDDQLKKVMMNKKDTTNTSSSMLDDQPKKVMVAAKVMKTTSATPNSIHKDRPNMMKMATQKEAAIKKSSTTTNVDKDDKPKAVVLENKKEMVVAKNLMVLKNKKEMVATKNLMVLERKKEMVGAKNLNNNISIGPKGNQDKKKVVVLPIRDEESSMQLKFESTKRKLHGSYERINAAKKQRSIQVIEFQKPSLPLPLPKPKARTFYHAKYPHKFHQPAVILRY